MTVERAVDDVLARLSDAQVEALAAAFQPLMQPDGALTDVAVGASPGAHDAIAALVSGWASRPSLSGDAVALALRIGLRARRDSDARRSRPVWTGPGASGEQRLTAAVLHELVAGANERILLVSYAAYTLAELAADLEAAVGRGCDVDVVFETEGDSAGAYAGPQSQPFGAVAGIRRWRWPGAQRTPGALLHAKLLVVDGCRALVGSANLTPRALTANLEAGVLIADHDLATELEAHVRRLIDGGTLISAELNT
ncbi:MAG: DISARM system phospholipase D-like protein DrmC [Solirubrobacteraceae bacterium]